MTKARYEGRVAIVTGAASGIGLATAKMLAAQGASVACIDNDAGALTHAMRVLNTEDVIVDRFLCDVADASQIKWTVANIVQTMGSPTILVNSAGIMPREDILEIEPDIAERVMAVNLWGPHRMAQAVWGHMAEAGGGVIVNISSIQVDGVFVRAGMYAVSKAALEALTKQLALLGGRQGIRVNCVQPGAIATPGMGSWASMSNEFVQDWRLRVPVYRRGTAEEVAQVILMLCSDDASYVNGANWPVTGGLELECRPTALLPSGLAQLHENDPDRRE